MVLRSSWILNSFGFTALVRVSIVIMVDNRILWSITLAIAVLNARAIHYTRDRQPIYETS
jgi:hypothetical protein